jgi:hypothetical protein
MKYYQIVNFDLDTRASGLQQKINDNWEKSVKENWEKNQQAMKNSYVYEFGALNNEVKLQNVLDLGSAPFSILAFHNDFLKQIRDSFIIGAYYPALTGACCLGERILNQLLLLLRDNFKTTEEYKKLYRLEQCDKWDVLINALSSWGILLEEVVKDYKSLKILRNDSIHFTKETAQTAREDALKAIKYLSNIIQLQFGAFAPSPWILIHNGGVYIKKDYEDNPFIKAVYLPNCELREVEIQ